MQQGPEPRALHEDGDAAGVPLLLSAQNTGKENCLSKFLNSFTALKVLSDDVSVFQITIVRSILGLSILVPFSYYQTGMAVGPADNMKWILVRGFFAAIAFMFGALSVTFLDISEAALLNNSHPVILAFLLSVLGIEAIDVLAWIGIIGAIVAQALIARPPFLFGGDDESWDLNRGIGIALCFLACLAQALGFLVIGKIDKKVPSIVIANHAAFQLFFIAVPFLAFGVPKTINCSPSLEDAALYIVASLSVLNQIFIVRAFQLGPSIQASIVSLSCPLMLVIQGAVLLSEELTWLDALGGALMLASIALVIWSRERGHKHDVAAQPLEADRSFSAQRV